MISALKQYLKKNIDEHVTIEPWLDHDLFPVSWRETYRFYEMMIHGLPCVLIEIINEMPDIDSLQKHINQLKRKTNHQPVLFYKEITKYRRKSLIENRLPFVIENGQMYMPFLGLHLNKAPQAEENDESNFSPSAQRSFLFFLYHKNEFLNATKLAKKMNFSQMTASRALRDLYQANLITYEIGGKTGRSKGYKRIPDPNYFFYGRSYIRSPVQRIVYAQKEPAGTVKAGLDALSELSMISSPAHPVRAIGREQFSKQKIEIIKDKGFIKDMKPVEIQVWNYDPGQFANKNHVDILSLYASLKDIPDERIEQALAQVLRGESWYMD